MQELTIEQLPVETVSSGFWDVVIIGAGPAGATAAINLARAGHRVVMLDKQAFPRDKACGDGLLPDAVESLKRSGVEDRVRARGKSMCVISVYSPSGHNMEIPGTYMTIRRRELDSLIAAKAVEEGAAFAQAKVRGFSTDSRNFAAQCSSGFKVRGRIGIVATGAHLDLLQPAKMIRRPNPDALALRFYVRSSLKLDRMVFSFDRSIVPSYAWIFPLRDGIYNVGCGISLKFYKGETRHLRRIFETFLAEFPVAKELLAHGTVCSPVRGSTLRYGLNTADPVSAGNVLACGETIGTTYPFSGEGIGKAMETAEIASALTDQALKADDLTILQRFPAELQARLKFRYDGYYAAERWLSSPRFLDFMTRRAQKSRFLQRGLAGIVNESVDPKEIFSLRGFLKLLIS